MKKCTVSVNSLSGIRVFRYRMRRSGVMTNTIMGGCRNCFADLRTVIEREAPLLTIACKECGTVYTRADIHSDFWEYEREEHGEQESDTAAVMPRQEEIPGH